MSKWNTYKLEDTLDALIDYRGKSPKKSQTGIPVLSAKVVKTSGLLEPIEQTISDDYYSIWMTRGLPKSGDVVFTTEGPMGEVIQLNETTATYALGQRIVCLRGKPNLVENTYLRYLLTSPAQQHILSSYATGTTVMGISQKALRSVPVNLPDTEYQKEVASVLLALDNKIELNRQMNETLEAMAQAIFKDWFVDFGPTVRKAEGETDPVKILGGLIPDPVKAAPIAALFPDSLGGDGLPMGWMDGTLEDIITFNPSERLKKGMETLYLGMSSLPTSGMEVEQPELRAFGSGTKFRNGDALFARITPCLENGKGAFIDCLTDEHPVGWGSTEYIVMRAEDRVPTPVPYLVSRHLEFRAFAEKRMTGTSGRQRVKADVVKSYPFPKFEEDIFDIFGQIVSPMFEKISANAKENQTLAETRDYLLPKLMSGEVRVGEAAPAATAETSNVVGLDKDLFGRKQLPADQAAERDAVMVAAIIDLFDSYGFVVGNFRYQKGVYFLKRYLDLPQVTTTKQAAGPYDAALRYEGGHKIAKDRRYIREAFINGKTGNKRGSKITDAKAQIDKFGLTEGLKWVENNLRFKSNDELECLATVDFAMNELRARGSAITVDTITQDINRDDVWRPKLTKAHFRRDKIRDAIAELNKLFGAV